MVKAGGEGEGVVVMGLGDLGLVGFLFCLW
jgi:hypothetical protein